MKSFFVFPVKNSRCVANIEDHVLPILCIYSFRQVGSNLVIPGGARIIDARGKLVIPGELFVIASGLTNFLSSFYTVLHHWFL